MALRFLILALQADDRPLTTLKYRGPYPTLALFESLGASFMPPTPVEEALRRFTEGVEEAALAARVVEPSVAFRPSPFELQWLDERICFQQRYGVERVFLMVSPMSAARLYAELSEMMTTLNFRCGSRTNYGGESRA